MRNQLTWDKATRTFLINGQPSTRKKGSRGFNPRRRAKSERRLKREEEARLRLLFTGQGHAPEKVELLVYLHTCSTRKFIKYMRAWQKALKCKGHAYHSWEGGVCRRCGKPSAATLAARKRWRAAKLKELGL